MSDSVKCFVVSAGDPEDTEIMFARSSIEAKRRWSNTHWNGDEIAGISAKRAQRWDKYAATGVPALEMIEDGWWFECQGCSTRICDEYIVSRGAPPHAGTWAEWKRGKARSPAHDDVPADAGNADQDGDG